MLPTALLAPAATVPPYRRDLFTVAGGVASSSSHPRPA
jgi:hypothetical protein